MIFPGPSVEDTARDSGSGSARGATPVTVGLVAGGALAAVLVAVVGVSLAGRGTGELRIPGAGATTVLRAAVFAALAVHLGELAGTRLARTGPARTGAARTGPARTGAARTGPARTGPARTGPARTGAARTGPVTIPVPAPAPGAPEPRRLAVTASLVGAAASAGQILLLARVSGLDLATVYGTSDGRFLLVMANGFLLAAGCATLTRPALALAPLAAVVGAEALRAHPEPYTPMLGVALTVVHLTAASLWTGGLLYVLRAMWLRRGDPAGSRDLLGRYARHAARLLAALAATGTLSTLRRLPADVVLTSAYGRVLMAKLVLVAVVCALALTARVRLRRGGDAGRPARAELAFLALVVLVSAVLTVVPDPHWLSTR
ncbi:CopD family protein [Streptomyces sp. NPDC059134]|uniref:CopD family protein n=1 Tax=Streptomyces sp. NPDC059134 TaxID=3346738 RepID=UPI00369F0E96